MTGEKNCQWFQILHYKHDQYANFQYPDIFGSLLECGLLVTLLILPTPDLEGSKMYVKKYIPSGFLRFWPIVLLFKKIVVLAHSEGCGVSKVSLSSILNHFEPDFVKNE